MIAVPPSAPALRAEDLDPVSDPRWAGFVADAPRAQVFHTPAWLALLQRSYGYKLIAHVLLDADGAIVAGVPLVRVGGRLRGRRLSALPFSDHCSPLLAAGADPALDAQLAESLRELGR